jgi:hypothetical protein
LDRPHSFHRPSGVIVEADAEALRDVVKSANIRNVIFPFDTSYKVWWGITVAGAIATAFLLPYEIAFQEEMGVASNGDVLEIILEVIFCTDILVNFNLAFYKDTRLTFQRLEIIRSYLRCMFWVDLCGVFPFEFVALWATGNLRKTDSMGNVLLFSLWRLPRLVRLRRLKKFSDIMQFDGHISFLWFTLIRNFAAVLLVAHW